VCAIALRRDRTGTPSSATRRRPRAGGVVGGIDDHQNAAKILGGRAHQRRSADIDLLDERVERSRRVGRRFHERVQVDHDEIDEAQPVALELGKVVGSIAPRENAAVKRRMQRLHASSIISGSR